MTLSSQPGLRWLLPWFLLDGLFYTRTKSLSVKGLDDNPRALAVLAKLVAAVDKGVAARHLQTAPHLVLLSKRFYEAELKPLLAEWLLFFLREHKLQKLNDKEAVAYLLTRKPPGSQRACYSTRHR